MTVKKKVLMILAGLLIVLAMLPTEAKKVYAETEPGETTIIDLSTAQDLAINLSDTSFIYNGEAHTPDVEVVLDGMILSGETDYTVAYENNMNAGPAQVIITGKEPDYTGSVTVDFTIEKADQTVEVSGTAITKKLNASSFVIKASLTEGDGAITFASSKTSIATVDKDTGKVSMKKPGKTTITVTAAETENYNKVTKKVILTVGKPATTKWVSVKAYGKKKVVFKWKKITGVTGCQIQYSKSSKFASGNKTLTVKGASKTSKTITMPAGETKYYVRIRTYKTVGKVTSYSAWSSKKSVTSKTTMEEWIRLWENEEQKLGDYWYYCKFDPDYDNWIMKYTIYREDEDGNSKKMMSVSNRYSDDELYTNGDYVIVRDKQYRGPVIWRYNMDGSGKKKVVDLRRSSGGYGIYEPYLYGRYLYYNTDFGLTTNYKIYKVDILTKKKTVAKTGLITTQTFAGRYAIFQDKSMRPWVFDAKTKKYRKLASSVARVFQVGNYWYYATHSSGTYKIWRKSLSGSGTAKIIATIKPPFKTYDVDDVERIDEEAAYIFDRNKEQGYMYLFAKKKLVKADY